MTQLTFKAVESQRGAELRAQVGREVRGEEERGAPAVAPLPQLCPQGRQRREGTVVVQGPEPAAAATNSICAVIKLSSAGETVDEGVISSVQGS